MKKNLHIPSLLIFFFFLQVCRTIENELGESMDDMFSDFVKVPLATASVRSSEYVKWNKKNNNRKKKYSP